MQSGAVLYLLLLGGEKSGQQCDIKSALKMARELKLEKPLLSKTNEIQPTS